jgi:hypothetical protein
MELEDEGKKIALPDPDPTLKDVVLKTTLVEPVTEVDAVYGLLSVAIVPAARKGVEVPVPAE